MLLRYRSVLQGGRREKLVLPLEKQLIPQSNIQELLYTLEPSLTDEDLDIFKVIS
jgi:hypothetical protein